MTKRLLILFLLLAGGTRAEEFYVLVREDATADDRRLLNQEIASYLPQRMTWTVTESPALKDAGGRYKLARWVEVKAREHLQHHTLANQRLTAERLPGIRA